MTEPSVAWPEPLRIEDPDLLRGEARFVADLDLDDCVVAHYVCSSMAHGVITGIDVEAARLAPGVLAVVTGEDLDAAGLPAHMPGHPDFYPPETVRPVLARDRVRYVGEPIVAIVAGTQSEAVDAAELVVIDIDPLAAVVDPIGAADDEPIFSAVGSNVIATEARADSAPIDLEDYEVGVTFTVVNQRLAPAPIETRVGAARWEGGRLHHMASCQGVHPLRDAFAAYYGLDRAEVRVTTADVGGSFGAKARFHVEDLLLGHLSRLLDRPVRWLPDRSADMVGLGHSRAQHQRIRIAGDADGRIRALQADITVDCGAYPIAGLHLARNTTRMLPGPYDIETVHWSIDAVVTNTTPTTAYRGAGRPEAGALLDRAVDRFAAAAGLDPIDVRRRNLLDSAALPHTNQGGVTYDSGDYPAAFELVSQSVGASGIRDQQRSERAAGATTQRGLGFSVFIDRTAGVPSSEYGRVELQADGNVRVLTGSSPYGQGHHTTWAQLVRDRTGIAMERIVVEHGDTDLVPRGGITGGSRSAQIAGSAVAIATDDLIALAKDRAAALLEASPSDVVLDTNGGVFHITGSPGAASVGWDAVAEAQANEAPAAEAIAFACENDYAADGPSVPYGAYAAVVAVDTATGEVTLERMVSVDDAGSIINHQIVAGQIHGGIGQGIGQALWEEMTYDDDGNPRTANFMDYGIPSAAEMPSFEVHVTEHPSPNNPLGAKGIAESGTIGAVGAIQNAVIDAVAHLGVSHIDLPTTPQRVWRAITTAQTEGERN